MMIVGSILSRASNVFTYPKFNDFEWMKLKWNTHKKSASRSLGAFKSLYATLAELAKYEDFNTYLGVSTRRLITELEEAANSHQRRMGGDEVVVGDTGEVHHIIPPTHVMGYAVDRGDDGYTLETIEGLQHRVCVLRQYGVLMGAEHINVLRTEHYGNIHII